MQCTLPPPRRISRPGTVRTRRSGKSLAYVSTAASSWRVVEHRQDDDPVAEIAVDVRAGQPVAAAPRARAGHQVEPVRLGLGRIQRSGLVQLDDLEATGRGHPSPTRGFPARRALRAYCGSEVSSVQVKATTPGAMKRAKLSTWPSVSSSRRRAGARSPGRRARWSPRTASISSRVRSGLRLGLSRHSSVVSRVPSPSTSIEPPSRMRSLSSTSPARARRSWSRRRHRRPTGSTDPTADRPSALKAQSTRAEPAPVVDEERRTAVPDPGVVGRGLEDPDVAPAAWPARWPTGRTRSGP